MTAAASDRFTTAIAEIDAANAQDPSRIDDGGTQRPAELVYGERMSTTLAGFEPEASEALQIATRAQHIQRWIIPRSTFPMDRTGYLRWRTELKRKHADLAGAIMSRAGYADADIARVGSLIRKERLKRDPESQTLEDVACLVFLQHYIDDFAAKHDDDKLVSILRKTWVKMSPRGHEVALRLALSPRVAGLVGRALQSDALSP